MNPTAFQLWLVLMVRLVFDGSSGCMLLMWALVSRHVSADILAFAAFPRRTVTVC
jgi:hypothetical protein